MFCRGVPVCAVFVSCSCRLYHRVPQVHCASVRLREKALRGGTSVQLLCERIYSKCHTYYVGQWRSEEQDVNHESVRCGPYPFIGFIVYVNNVCV